MQLHALVVSKCAYLQGRDLIEILLEWPFKPALGHLFSVKHTESENKMANVYVKLPKIVSYLQVRYA